MKILRTLFPDFNGVMNHVLLLQGRTVNKEYYLKVKLQFRQAIPQKRTELWKNKSWIFRFDNAQAYTLWVLGQKQNVIMPQPPYSADLASADIFLCPGTEDTDESKVIC